MPKPTREAFRAVLGAPEVRALQIIYLAIAGGVVLFAVVVAALYWWEAEAVTPKASQISLVQLLSFAHVLVAATVYLFAGAFIYRRMLTAGSEDETAEAILGKIRTAEVVRLALYEGVAMLGLVTCLLGVLFGVLRQMPVYWLNLFSTFVLLGFVASNIPTAERIEGVFRTYVEGEPGG